MSINWTEIEVPRGAFVGWGEHPGQHVTGKVLSYDDNGGTDFAGERCPQVAIELIEPAASFDKAGTRTDFAPGELVQINAGQVGLKRAVRAAALSAGDLVKITLNGLERVAAGTVKVYGIKVARGAGGAAQTTSAPAPVPAQSFSAPAPAPAFDAAPPF